MICHTQKMFKNQFLFALKLEKSTYKFSASRKRQPAFPLSIPALSNVRFKGTFLTTSIALTVKTKVHPVHWMWYVLCNGLFIVEVENYGCTRRYKKSHKFDPVSSPRITPIVCFIKQIWKKSNFANVSTSKALARKKGWWEMIKTDWGRPSPLW